VGGIFRFYIYFVPNFYVAVFQNLLASIDGDFIVGDGGDVTRCCFGSYENGTSYTMSFCVTSYKLRIYIHARELFGNERPLVL